MVIKVTEAPFGQVDERAVKVFKLANDVGMSVELLNYGAIVKSILLPGGAAGDEEGSTTDVCLGFDDIQGYLGAQNPYFGCIVGRVANRIAGGTFRLDGTSYTLARNNGPNSLHGGLKGFDKKVWEASSLKDGVCFSMLSPDGDEGYPGDLLVNVSYKLTEDNALEVAMKAVTTKPTPVNLTNHSYFNLAGHDSGAEAGLYLHEVTMNADHYLPVNEDLLPTGGLARVETNPVFDLRRPTLLGEALPQCPGGPNSGFDHNFCINASGQHDLRMVCRVKDVKSGRKMECHSDQPGVQFYTGNFLPKVGQDDGLRGKGGALYVRHGGFCLETQMYPDAVNQPDLKQDCILRPGDVYTHRVAYKFFF